MRIGHEIVNTDPASKASYRPDVDGLRAIAVLAVILFHIDKSLLPGGFVGVDVFFVISGFLITRNIVQELDRGAFSIVEFYRRRVKRIAPVMLLVISVTLVGAQLLMLPEEARTTAKSAVWSLFPLANVYFWLNQDTGYFAASTSEVPLLHLWTLGVEEQFYILWPLLLLGFYRPGREKPFLLAALAMAFGSFLLGQVLFERAPSFVYYMLPTRAGELLIGAIVAIAVLKGIERKFSPALVTLAATVGFLLLIATLLLLTENHPFPGWLALPPTLGTGLLILAGHCRDNRLSRLLSLKPLVWVGLVSYSAYLWHWPLLAFYRYGYGNVGPFAGAVVLALTLLLAWISYLYVEQPARRSRAPVFRVIAKQYVVPAGTVMMFALGTVYADRIGIALPSEAYRAHLADIRNQTRPAFLFEWVCQRQRILKKDMLDERCVLGTDSADAARAILWGDSNAAHYIGMIDVFAREAGFRFRNVEIGSCPPVDGDPKPFVNVTRESDCRESLNVVRPVVKEFPVVIISASWLSYEKNSAEFLQTFFKTARALAETGKLVILIGNVPVITGYDRRCREKALSYPFLNCPNITVPVSAEIANINARLRRFAEQTANIRYFEATPYLCPNGNCSAFGPGGEPRYFDEGHLTLAASSKIGREIVSRDGVPPAFALIADWRRAIPPNDLSAARQTQ